MHLLQEPLNHRSRGSARTIVPFPTPVIFWGSFS
ncbi:hypothetical protein E2C01_082683 [Portunus trituberculatus]|uniref:Uncharacterized protein n=1 Tax=Portunus trituberculatus TaxID=210409 RepID=A0A5B7J2E3_PORTR|nr:hypothetical protein [Portunus trituberculatus]